jgi:molybdate transport system substrate-binding protein
LAVQQMSELMAIAGVDVVGPFPEPYRAYTSFAAGIFASSNQPEGARQFIDHLTSDLAAAAFAEAGLESLENAGAESGRRAGSGTL